MQQSFLNVQRLQPLTCFILWLSQPMTKWIITCLPCSLSSEVVRLAYLRLAYTRPYAKREGTAVATYLRTLVSEREASDRRTGRWILAFGGGSSSMAEKLEEGTMFRKYRQKDC